MGTCILLAVCALAGQAATAADDDLGLEVRRLVRQLNAPQLAEREAAEASLLKLGPKVLDLLPPADEQTPAEVVQRVGRVRQKLQLAAAEAAARPSLITLHADAMPLSKVLAAIEQQSGNKLVDFRQRFGQQPTDPPLTLDLDQTPFWEALAKVLDQAALDVYPFGEPGTISLVARGTGLPGAGKRVAYGGPFRFEPRQIVATRDLSDPSGHSLRLMLSVAWEPRLKPIGLKQQMADLKAVDENGNPLPVAVPEAAFEAQASGTSSVELQLPFIPPPRSVQAIASLKGRLDVMLPGKVETFRFGNLIAAKMVEQRVAGVTVTLEQVRQNGSIWEVRMRARFDEAGKALESHRGWILNNEAFLEGPDGKPISYDTMELTAQSENEIGIAYGFVLDGPPTQQTFVYKTPGVIMSTGVEYELHDILLP